MVIFKKAGHLKKIGVTRNLLKNLNNPENMNIPKNETFEEFGGNRNFQKNVNIPTNMGRLKKLMVIGISRKT